MPAPLRQLGLQLAATILILSLAWPYHLVTRVPLDWESTGYLIGIAAFALATWGRLPWWWRLIHLVFAPAAVAVARLGIDPGWFLAASMLLLLTYRGALTGQIPLFLSGDDAREALLRIARERNARCVVDLGAGIGSLLVPLARDAPDIHWVGIENSPIPWLIARLRAAFLPNCEIRYGDFWNVDLGPFPLVYAFLSPAPMAKLWDKARAELGADAELISNSFPIPELEADEVIDAGAYTLYRYRGPTAPSGNSLR